MRSDFARHDRVAGLLRRELATLIWAEINDPRLGPLSVSDVEVTRDLAHAKVYVTSSEPETMPDTLKVLKKAAGFLRSRLGKTLKMRHIPELHFNHDDSIEKGAAMDALIEEAVAGKKPVGGDQQD
jgi:ribosome-binding factor A